MHGEFEARALKKPQGVQVASTVTGYCSLAILYSSVSTTQELTVASSWAQDVLCRYLCCAVV